MKCECFSLSLHPLPHASSPPLLQVPEEQPGQADVADSSVHDDSPGQMVVALLPGSKVKQLATDGFKPFRGRFSSLLMYEEEQDDQWVERPGAKVRQSEAMAQAVLFRAD